MNVSALITSKTMVLKDMVRKGDADVLKMEISSGTLKEDGKMLWKWI